MSQNKKPYMIVFALFFFLSYFSFSKEETQDSFLIKGGKIYTSSSRGVLSNASLLIEKGKIKKIIQGQDLPSVPVKDYSGKFIMPGMVDAHTYLSGYYRLLENAEVMTSDLIAFAAFDPLNPEVRLALRSGITTVNFTPRNENLVGGVSSVFKLTEKPDALKFLKQEAFLKISFNAEVVSEDRAPTSLMGAQEILSERMRNTKEVNKRAEVFKQEGIRRLLKGILEPMIAASTFEEMNTAVKWLEQWDMKGVVVGGEEACRLSKVLKKREIPVLLSSLLFSFPDKMAEKAAFLQKEGVTIAFVSNTPEGNPLGLRFSALMLYHQGILLEEALKTITIYPAQILGVEHSVGSIEEGKDADIVVLSGEPLDLSSEILAVYSGGNLVFKKEKKLP